MDFKVGDKVIYNNKTKGTVTRIDNKFPGCPIEVEYLISRRYAYMADGREHPDGDIVLEKLKDDK